jgi:hypothetical protein
LRVSFSRSFFSFNKPKKIVSKFLERDKKSNV